MSKYIKAGLFVFSIILTSISFFLPPQGIIDPSVLTAIGELSLIYFVLFELRSIIEVSKSITMKKGDTEIEIKRNEEEE